MDEHGTPANQPDVPCPEISGYAAGPCDAAPRASCTSATADTGASSPMTPTEPPRRPARDTLVPFVVQAGQRVFMLASESDAWVLAELKFDDERVAFIETRRSLYDWPREAFGALLSRVALRDTDDATVAEVALDFNHWLGGQFA